MVGASPRRTAQFVFAPDKAGQIGNHLFLFKQVVSLLGSFRHPRLLQFRYGGFGIQPLQIPVGISALQADRKTGRRVLGRRFLYFPCSCRFCLQKLFQSLKLLLPALFLFHLPCKEPGSIHQFHPLSGLLPGGQKPVQVAGSAGPPEEGKQPLCISPFCEGAVVLFPHCRLFHLLLQLLRPFRLQTSGEDQLLLSAGHGHVQHAQFLSQAVPLQLSGHHVLFQGPPLHSQDAVHIVQAYP